MKLISELERSLNKHFDIDRTHWNFGKKPINVFMLSLAYEGLAIPVFWHLLPKDGASSAAEQIALINVFIQCFGVEHIVGLLADREFMSGDLVHWLKSQQIDFWIRIKGNLKICIQKKQFSQAVRLFQHLHSKHSTAYSMAVWICGEKVFLAGARSERGELMIVATSKSPKNAISIYLRRWEIENLFQGLKGRGFCFEDTHLTDPSRIAKLMALLAVGFVWAHKVGEFQPMKQPILFKKFRDQPQRPQYSIFRYGLDFITNAIFRTRNTIQPLKNLIKLLEIPSLQEVT